MGGLGAGAFDLERERHFYYFNLGRQEESK